LFLTLYIAFLLYFILFHPTGLDFQFALCLWLILAIEVLRVNGLIGYASPDETHTRYPNETEKNITNSFFEGRKLEIPVFFVQDNPDCYGAYVGYLCEKVIYVLSERLFRSCSIREIWAVLAHERGHVENGDITKSGVCLVNLKNWIFYISLWFSILALLKIVWYSLVFPPEYLLFSSPVCLLISYGIAFFLVILRPRCDKVLYDSMQVLADNTGAQRLGSALWMLECLQMLNSRIDFPDFPLREKALLWILKDETLKL
jgi:Zn-dependent protease with chaperone function